MKRLAIIVAVAASLGGLGCKTDKTPHLPIQEVPKPQTAHTVDPTASPSEPWTPDRVRAFVLETHLLFDGIVAQGYKRLGRDPKPSGECTDGQGALPVANVSDVMPAFEQRLQGEALQCYLATYFHCRVGEWLSHGTNMSNTGPPNVPFTESKVTILKQTPDSVVADVVEAEPADVSSDGVLDREKVRDANFKTNSRYTLVRDRKGTWRISSRVPNNGPMECKLY